MAYIASGGNATFTVPANNVIDVQCPGGFVQLEYPAGTKIFEGNVGTIRTFGPFAGGSAKLTSLQGGIYYEVDPREAQNTPFDPANVAITGGIVGGSDVKKFNPTVKKFFDCLPKGANFRSRLSLLNPTAWVTATTYQTGSVVQNAGNIYLCQNSAPAASSVAPTATTFGPISDGTLKWLYMGPVPSASSLAPAISAPAFSYGTRPASCTRKYDFSTNGTTPNTPADIASVLFTGGVFGPLNAFGFTNGAWGVAAQNPSAAITFKTDSPIVAFNAYANLPAGNFGQFEIDGYQMLPHGANILTTALLPGCSILDFTALPNKTRTISAWISNQPITGIGIPPQYKIWAPTNASRYRLLVEGDSTTAGATPTNGGLLRPYRLGRMLGCDDTWCTAVGGTGFLAGSPTLIQRISSVISAAPDIVYIAPTLNDSSFTSSQRQAAYLAYFTALLAGLPNVICLVAGGWAKINAADTSATSSFAVENDLSAAVAAFANPNFIFIPSTNNTEGSWLTGDGHIGTTVNANIGNTNLQIGDGTDALHPNQRGVDYLMQRDYDGVVKAMTTYA